MLIDILFLGILKFTLKISQGIRSMKSSRNVDTLVFIYY